MKINIYTISKDKDRGLDPYIVRCSRFGVDIKIFNIFNNKVSLAQKSGESCARRSYTQAFIKHLDSNCVLLSENGEQMDSIGFSKFIEKSVISGELNFFIAGAFGFDKELLARYKAVSLGRLTFTHTLAKTILLDQVYRAFCIINNHPYHKGI